MRREEPGREVKSMKVGIFIGAVLFVVLYVISIIYVSRRIQEGFSGVLPEKSRWVLYMVMAVLAFSLVFGMMPVSYGVKRIFSTMGAYFMGFYAYALMLFLVRDGVFLIGKLLKIKGDFDGMKLLSTSSVMITVLSLALVVYGTVHAGNIKTVSYEVDSYAQSLPEKMKIVLLSDLHLGAVGSESRLPEIIKKVQAEEPDLVLLSGDIFDDDFMLLRDPQKAIKLFQGVAPTYGIYASLGNHDGGKTFPQMLQFLEESRITVLLEQHQVVADSFVILGRLDPSPIGGFGGDERQETKEVLSALPEGLPVIVLDHTPSHVEQYGKEVDLVLSGHTHKGQIFPFQLGTKLLFNVDYGFYKRNEEAPAYIVTSGAGTWGPPMRIGTNSEIVRITLQRVK